MGLFSKKDYDLYNIITDGNKDLLLQALNEGIDINSPDYRAWQPLTLAVNFGNTEIVEILLKYGAMTDSGTPLLSACAIKNKEIIELLLKYCTNPNQADQNGWTPLMVAAQNGDIETVKHLLDKGADANIHSNDGWTALHAATKNNHTDIALLLLELNADPYTESKTKETPFSLATKNNNFEILKRIWSSGYKPPQNNTDKDTAQTKIGTTRRKRKRTTDIEQLSIWTDRFGTVLYKFLYSVKHDKDLPEYNELRIYEGNKITKKIILTLLLGWVVLMVFLIILNYLGKME